MSEESVSDYAAAKRRAAKRLGLRAQHDMPTNEEIQNSLADYQQLFNAEEQALRLTMLRDHAQNALSMLEQFSPTVTGAVVDNIATAQSFLEIHVFADAAEEVSMLLHEEQIDHRTTERRYRFGKQEYRRYPALSFIASDLTVEIIVFPLRERGHAPLSQTSDKPIRRLNAKQLARALAQNQAL